MTNKTDNAPKAKSSIMRIAAYVPGKSGPPSAGIVHKLSANESALGTSGRAEKAIKNYAAKSAIYPDGGAQQLRAALADKYELEKDQFILGNGSGELLQMIAQTYVSEGDETIITQHGFLLYPIVTLGAGGHPVTVAEKNYCADVDAILAAITRRTKIVFLANPNNPTGTYLPFGEIERLADGLPSSVLLVLDGAYADYVTANDYQDGLRLASTRANVVVVQTFSKIGLANLRVGWLYGAPEIIDALNRLRGPFNVNGFAQIAAIETLEDRDFWTQLKHYNAKWRDWAINELGNITGLSVLPTQANFIQVLFDMDGEKSAETADAYLTEKGFIARAMHAYGIPNGLRLSIGPEEGFKGAILALKQFMAD